MLPYHWRDFRWRVGRKVGRTIYVQVGEQPSDDDPLIGVMDTADLARQVVAAVNDERTRRLGLDQPG